jgi:hypothetical protein
MFSPTLLKDLLKVIVAVAVKLALPIQQMDVKLAYLHGDIDVRVVIELPEMVYPDAFHRKNIGVCKKALNSVGRRHCFSTSAYQRFWCDGIWSL